MPQEIPVRSAVKILLIALFGFFTYRQRYRAVGITPAYSGDYAAYSLVRKIRVLPALQHERAVPQGVPLLAAREYLLFAKSVSLRVFVSAAYAAIIAVVFAIVRKFYKPSDVYLVSVVFSPRLFRRVEKLRVRFARGEQR